MEPMGESSSLIKLLVAVALAASSCSFITDPGDVDADGDNVDLAATDDSPNDESDDSPNDQTGESDESDDDAEASPTTTEVTMEAAQWERLPLELVLIAGMRPPRTNENCER